MATPSLSWAVTYRKTEDRLTALLAVALNENDSFRESFCRRLNRDEDLPRAGVQLSKKIPGTDPDIYFGDPDHPELVIEAKLKTSLRQSQFDALRSAERDGLVGDYRLLGGCSEIFRGLKQEDLEEANSRRLSWSDVLQDAATFRADPIVNALVDCIVTEHLMDFSGLETDALLQADNVLAILMEAKRLGEAVYVVCRRKGLELSREHSGSLVFDSSLSGDAHFAWKATFPGLCYFYIGFGTHYRFYTSVWVPTGSADVDEAPDGWSVDKGYFARTWALADELKGLSAAQQIDHLVGLWSTAVADAFPSSQS